MRGALYFGHPGNRGDAVRWGDALGAKLLYMSGYQGHGSVAHPHGVLVTWAVIMEGGFQVNSGGVRFSMKATVTPSRRLSCSRNPMAWRSIFSTHALPRLPANSPIFSKPKPPARSSKLSTIADLATRLHLPADALARTFAEVEDLRKLAAKDRFGRSFAGSSPLSPPFKAVKVTGALFHTQGGLAVDPEARVLGRARAAFAQPLCRRRRRGRRFRLARQRLSVGQRLADGDRARPPRRSKRGQIDRPRRLTAGAAKLNRDGRWDNFHGTYVEKSAAPA